VYPGLEGGEGGCHAASRRGTHIDDVDALEKRTKGLVALKLTSGEAVACLRSLRDVLPKETSIGVASVGRSGGDLVVEADEAGFAPKGQVRLEVSPLENPSGTDATDPQDSLLVHDGTHLL
jgi:hypothetical protein